MGKLHIKRKFWQYIREYPLQAFAALWLGVMAFSIVSLAIFLPHSNNRAAKAAGLAETENSATENSTISAPSAARVSYADIVERAAPSVVTVRSERKVAAQQMDSPLMNDPMFRQFFGGRMPQMKQAPQIERGLGSGVIVEANGTILTNNHVVEGAQQIKVELTDKRAFNAKVVGTDPASDLAVLKIEASDLPALALGDSDGVRVGDVVLAIGNPLGLQQTVTSGIISAKGRSTGLSDGSFEDFLQTDAPINHGNSGGALVSTNGELIGINSQILSPGGGGNIGIGFAIPSNMARSVMQQLLKDGKVHRGMLGVGIQNVTSDLAEQFGLKEIRGVIVNSVKANSAGEKAGIKPGDVILGFNGANIADGNELRNKVAATAPGTTVNLTVWREGKEQNLSVTLAEFSAEKAGLKDSDDENPAESSTNTPKLGVALSPLTPEIARQIGVSPTIGGLAVTDVEEGSAAEDAGIAPGDVIVQINRRAVNSAADVKAALASAEGKPVLLLINRKGQSLFLTVRAN